MTTQRVGALKRNVAIVLLLLGLTWPVWADAATFPVTVDPQSFLGTYFIPGVTATSVSGTQTFNVVPGTYSLDIGLAGSCSRKAFTVNSDGTVSNPSAPSPDSSGALDFIGNTVRFKNNTVNFNGDAYQGRIRVLLSNLLNFIITSTGSLTIVPDNIYRIGIDGAFHHVLFQVNALGQVEPVTPIPSGCFTPNRTVQSNDGLLFSGNTVTLRNTTVRFDPRLFPGNYAVAPVSSAVGFVKGIQDVVLIPGFDAVVNLTSLNSFGLFTFKVNPDGSVGLFSPPAPLVDSANQIDFDNAASPPAVKFKNTTVNFDPGPYQGNYFFDRTTAISNSPQTGPTSHILVPDTKYEMSVAGNRIGYYVEPAGNVQGTPFGSLNNAADIFDLQGNTVRFRTTRIFVSPSNSSKWRLSNVTLSSGIQGNLQVTVVPKLTYTVVDFDASIPNNASFDVQAPCAVVPDGGVTIQATFYRITCIPQANAGTDHTVNEGILVNLDGTGSSFPTGAQQHFAWTQVAGPPVTLNGATTETPSFTAPEIDPAAGSQILTFRLIVNDGIAFSDADTIDITDVHVNKKPVADAGDDFHLREGATGQLNGTHSFDPDGDGLTYTWTQKAGTVVTLLPNNAVANPTFQAPLGNGTPLLFQLQVSDGHLPSDLSAGNDSAAVDTMQITVGANTAPMGNAGPDQTVNEATLVHLDGTLSQDTEGDGLHYQWMQISGPSTVALTGATSVTSTFTAPFVGAGGATYTFSLVVTDDYVFNPKSSASDSVIIHVRNTNDPPRCDLAVPSVAKLWPPNHKMHEIEIAGVSDANAGDTLTVTVTGISQDEPVNGLGDGDTSPDAVILNGSLLLRAERSGSGNGRVYQVQFTASDGSDVCTGAVKVSVPHSRQSTAVDDGQSYNSTLP
jgi:hypothetical protein